MSRSICRPPPPTKSYRLLSEWQFSIAFFPPPLSERQGFTFKDLGLDPSFICTPPSVPFWINNTHSVYKPRPLRDHVNNPKGSNPGQCTLNICCWCFPSLVLQAATCWLESLVKNQVALLMCHNFGAKSHFCFILDSNIDSWWWWFVSWSHLAGHLYTVIPAKRFYPTLGQRFGRSLARRLREITCHSYERSLSHVLMWMKALFCAPAMICIWMLPSVSELGHTHISTLTPSRACRCASIREERKKWFSPSLGWNWVRYFVCVFKGELPWAAV